MLVRGLVVTGKGEGKKIGYPTANIEHATARLEPGVYCVRALIGSRVERGLAVVGMWTQKNNLPSLEVYFLDVSADLYGREVAVVFEKRLRDLKQFSSVESLLAQIGKDVEDAREVFGHQ